jgi:hypothetical protein
MVLSANILKFYSILKFLSILIRYQTVNLINIPTRIINVKLVHILKKRPVCLIFYFDSLQRENINS